MLEQSEIDELKRPAVGAYANLFTSRAAQELTELLVPVIKERVVFHFSYQYAAWVKVLMDLKMIRCDKQNGTLILNLVRKMFGENLSKSTLSRCLNNDIDFDKIKVQYDLIMSFLFHL